MRKLDRIGQAIFCVVSAFTLLLMVPTMLAKSHKDFPEKYSDIYMPISLATGTVRTPEFSTTLDGYDIIIQAERPLPISQIICMMGATASPWELKECGIDDPLLRADWTVWNEGHIVAHGSSSASGGRSVANDHIWKSLGGFAGEAGKRYVVEVKFTKDGTPLNVANPRLIVIRHNKFW
jgi:hypothetical protein